MFKPTNRSWIHGNAAGFRRGLLKVLQIFLAIGFLGVQLGMNPVAVAADTIPPSAPANLVLVVHGRVVDLSWTASRESDVVGYNVYRSELSLVKLTYPVNGSTLLASPKYHDLQLAYGVRYFYVVTAVNASGQESQASNEVSVMPAIVREQGQTVPDGMTPTGALAVSSLDTAGPLASAPNGPVVVAPINGATGIASPATLTVQVTDPDNSPMTVTFYGRQKTSVAAPNFTIVAIGDTQSYVLDPAGAAIFTGNLQWAADTQSANNIVFVTALGDITMDGNNDTDNSEWNIASTAYGKLERGTPSDGSDDVPFGIAPGNHDNLGGGWTRYENTFGVTRFSGRPYYGGHYGSDNTNNYSVFTASGMHFISIQLACVSSNLTSTSAVLNWADALLKADASRRGIVVCHDAMNSNSLATDGAAVYNALRDNPNFFLLLAGHAGVGRYTGSGTDGHAIYAVMSDYTGSSAGWIRRMEFQPAYNQISVKTYGPTSNGGAGSYKTTSADQFVLTYSGMQSPDFTLVGTAPNVASGSSGSINWSGLTSGTQYEWYAVASDGTSSSPSSISTFTTASQMSTLTPTSPPSNTPTSTFTPTVTSTATNTATLTPTPTASQTPTPGNTPTPTDTFTPAATPTATFTPANSPTATYTPTATPTRTPSAYQLAVVADNPVSYWRLGEASGTTAVDPVGGNSGTITGAVVLNVPGALPSDPDTAMNFDGATGYITVADDPNLDVTGDFTLEVWAKPAGPASAEQVLVSKAKSGQSKFWQYRLGRNASNHWFGTVYAGNATYTVVAPGTADPGRWAHLVLTRSGNQLALYVNGSSVASTVASGFLNVTNGSFDIGQSGASPVRYFAGSIDEVGVYNTALTGARIMAHYDAGTVGIPTATSTATPTYTASATSTPSSTATATNAAVVTNTSTPTATPTNTAVVTNTSTPTATSTITAIVTDTSTPTATSTNTALATNTSTPTVTPTNTVIVTNTSTPTATPTAAPVSDVIFADGFESGDLSAWSSIHAAAGSLSVTPQAALAGSYGLQVIVNSTASNYVANDLPNPEPQYRARFYFDPNSIVMADGNAHYILIGYDAVGVTPNPVFNVDFRYSAGSYQIRLRQQDDSQATLSTSWVTIGDALHVIEVQWQAATALGANNGSIALWIDGVQRGSLSALDNDTRRIERVRLGAASSVDAGTIGTYYLDSFESRRQTYIGP